MSSDPLAPTAPPLPEGLPHLAPVESPGQHLEPVEENDRHPVPELIRESGFVNIDAFEGPASATGSTLDDGVGLLADSTHRPGDESDRTGHVSSSRAGALHPSGNVVALMRPATVLAIVLLLLVLAVAGIVFVIQLQSVT
jgi:hypothetical protein